MKLNKAGLKLIKEFEGWRAEAYRDAVGVWTIGYGHTAAAGSPRPRSGMVITEHEGEAILKRDLEIYEKAVQKAVKVPLNDNQYSALVSFTYNLGGGNLNKSTLLKKLNAGDYAGAANEFPKWNRAGGKVLRGLTRRREAEKALFLKKSLNFNEGGKTQRVAQGGLVAIVVAIILAVISATSD